MLILEAVLEDNLDANEEPIVVSQGTLSAGDSVSLGGDRQWQVIETETYQGQEQTICLALVSLPDAIPDRAEWTDVVMREDDPLSLYLLLDPQQQLITNGLTFNGKPPHPVIYDYAPTGDGTELKPTKAEWLIEKITTCLPQSEKAIYDQIFICQCVPAKVPQVA